MTRKQKELDLETQEGSIRKHSTELNAVKTNDAYRALMGEIEKAKQIQSALEDEILQLMEQVDQATKSWKEKEASFRANESGLLKQISEFETKQKDLEQTLTGKQAERQAAFDALPKNLSAQYEKIRKGKRGAPLVPIRSEQCSGCHMKVSQSLINEVRRGQKMITCESCSRIVYLEDAVAAF
jgi:predicted  nucleic acid-binding Zn-ribbon protein